MVFFVFSCHSVGLFLFSYGIGLSLGWHSGSILSLWASMEVCMMSTVPLLSGETIQEADGGMVYFIFQVLGSSMVLVGSILLSSGMSGMGSLGILVYNLIMCMGLFMKLGLFPSYYWVVRCLSKVSWFNCFLITVPQKLLPLWLAHNLNVFDVVIDWVELGACCSSLVAVMMSPGVKDFRILFGYSSILHSSFMVLMTVSKMSLVFFYLSVYALISWSFCFTMWRLNINYASCIMKMGKVQKAGQAVVLSFYAFSLAGFPPFTGFGLKVLYLSCCMSFCPFGSVFLILLSAISFYFYYQIFVSVGMAACAGQTNIKAAFLSEEFVSLLTLSFAVNICGMILFMLVGLL